MGTEYKFMQQKNVVIPHGESVTEGVVPRKVPDAPQLETHISFIRARKDGKLWVKHETRMIDWKPFRYYEAGAERSLAENPQR